MQNICVIMVLMNLIFGLSYCQGDMSRLREDCKEFHNGCSVPRFQPSISIKRYGIFFEPACLRHDLCYSCVSEYSCSIITHRVVSAYWILESSQVPHCWYSWVHVHRFFANMALDIVCNERKKFWHPQLNFPKISGYFCCKFLAQSE